VVKHRGDVCVKDDVNIPFFILAILLSSACTESRYLTIASYNCGNLADAQVQGREYPDMIHGQGGPSPSGYRAHLSSLADVLSRQCPGGPDIVLLLEVEGAHVVRDLAAEPALKPYPWCVTSDEPWSPIQLALISRIPIVESTLHSWSQSGGYSLIRGSETGLQARPVLRVVLETGGTHLVIYVNHWPSMRGGADSRLSRLRSAELVAGLVAADRKAGYRYCIVGGDLNENWDQFQRNGSILPEALMTVDDVQKLPFPEGFTGLVIDMIPGQVGDDGTDSGLLYCPWIGSPFPGSYFYRNAWETIDHLLLSAAFFSGGELRYESFFTPENTLLRAGARGDPRESDHLPVFLRLARE